MNDIQVLNYNNHQIRQIASEDGEILFCAKDVLEALGTTTQLRNIELDDPEGGILEAPLMTAGGMQTAKFITEPTLYEILGKLNVPTVKPFRRWVTHEVLPSIRKSGSYNINQSHLIPKEIESMQKAIQSLTSENESLKSEISQLKEDKTWKEDWADRTMMTRTAYAERTKGLKVWLETKDGSGSSKLVNDPEVKKYLDDHFGPKERCLIVAAYNESLETFEHWCHRTFKF